MKTNKVCTNIHFFKYKKEIAIKTVVELKKTDITKKSVVELKKSDRTKKSVVELKE